MGVVDILFVVGVGVVWQRSRLLPYLAHIGNRLHLDGVSWGEVVVVVAGRLSGVVDVGVSVTGVSGL